MTTYPGGKGGSGVYQKIISLMPKHRVYIECFLGNGSILRYKKPADENLGFEIDEEVCKLWTGDEIPYLRILNRDALHYLEILSKGYTDQNFNNKETLIYCDPPYLKNVRRSQRQIYRYDMMNDFEHIRLLNSLLALKCNVMISGYDSEIYNRILKDWRKVEFTGISRAGKTTEVVWMNFPEPAELADYKFLGSGHRERENFKRKKSRWINKLKKMNPQERYAFLSAFEEFKLDLATSEMKLPAGDGGNDAARCTAEMPLCAGT